MLHAEICGKVRLLKLNNRAIRIAGESLNMDGAKLLQSLDEIGFMTSVPALIYGAVYGGDKHSDLTKEQIIDWVDEKTMPELNEIAVKLMEDIAVPAEVAEQNEGKPGKPVKAQRGKKSN